MEIREIRKIAAESGAAPAGCGSGTAELDKPPC
jgi:hypothetical protein